LSSSVFQLIFLIYVIILNIKIKIVKFVAIDGVIKNQLDKYATGCNTPR
jgi:hypothetical protein